MAKRRPLTSGLTSVGVYLLADSSPGIWKVVARRTFSEPRRNAKPKDVRGNAGTIPCKLKGNIKRTNK